MHGAGLTNVLFMNQYAAVIEILPTKQQFNNMIAPCDGGATPTSGQRYAGCRDSVCGFSHYWALAAAVGVSYHVLPVHTAAVWYNAISLPFGTLAKAVASIVRDKGGRDWNLCRETLS